MDIFNIFIFCDFKSQFYLSSSCKLFNNNLLITDKILKQSKYKHITKLNASDNKKIKDVNHKWHQF